MNSLGVWHARIWLGSLKDRSSYSQCGEFQKKQGLPFGKMSSRVRCTVQWKPPYRGEPFIQNPLLNYWDRVNFCHRRKVPKMHQIPSENLGSQCEFLPSFLAPTYIPLSLLLAVLIELVAVFPSTRANLQFIHPYYYPPLHLVFNAAAPVIPANPSNKPPIPLSTSFIQCCVSLNDAATSIFRLWRVLIPSCP